jgi:hypothetical protein
MLPALPVVTVTKEVPSYRHEPKFWLSAKSGFQVFYGTKRYGRVHRVVLTEGRKRPAGNTQ